MTRFTQAQLQAIAHLIGNALPTMAKDHQDYLLLQLAREMIRGGLTCRSCGTITKHGELCAECENAKAEAREDR